MDRIENLIKDVLHNLESQRKLHMQHVRETWEKVVPDEVFENTSILSFRQGKLKIGVRSQPLLSELENFRKEAIRENLEEAGLSSLEEISFTAI